ncbi:TetR family transcriptional regulator [Celerinatantimonas sp. YJH-8]|uniref:TetR family transcriptional regulator n=1 Tax=Celerinatantimonas sp. YJH-8 TaxID=3228714 RepID=UPI0038C5BA36
MARKTKEEAQKTRQAILNSALQLFCDKGLAETSLTDIANATGVTRGAIYWYFRNKNVLFVTLWDEMCEPLTHLMLASIDDHEPDPMGKLRSFLIKSLQSLSVNASQQQMFSILFNLESLDNELAELREHIKQQYQCFIKNLSQALNNAKVKGQIPPQTDMKICTDLLVAMVDGIILRFVQLEPEYPLFEQAESLADLMLKLIYTHTP